MNLADYEKIEADPALVGRIRFNTFYAMGKARDPNFVAKWSRVPEEEKVAAGVVGLQAIYALVDDYTTPGCKCKFCTWKGDSDHGRPVMCKKRWEALPFETRSQIAESMED